MRLLTNMNEWLSRRAAKRAVCKRPSGCFPWDFQESRYSKLPSFPSRS